MALIGKNENLDMKVVNNIKALGIDMINTANSGHPGIVLGAAPILYRLYSKHLVFDPKKPDWVNRDRFVMSAGHGSALLYATLFMSGFDITVEDLKSFRKYGSKTPGHPEVYETMGVDASTGPLGQGLGTAVGMAISEAYLNDKYKNSKGSLIEHYTYAFVSDGDLMEGISYEVGAIAASKGLGRLIVLYDSNGISLDGDTKETLSEDVLGRFKALGWDTHVVTDPYNFSDFDSKIEKAKQEVDKPSIIEIKTKLGKDSKYENTNLVHGTPLEHNDIKNIKKKLGIRDAQYTVLSDAYDYMKEVIMERCGREIKRWEVNKEKIMLKFSDELKKDFENLCNDDICIDLKKNIFKFDSEKSYSGRDLSNHILNKLSDKDILCLCTDIGSSTKVYFNDQDEFTTKMRSGKNIKCGVRELGASAIMNGILLSGIRAITSTFLSFSNYMIPSIRMASLMGLGGIYVFTHDSVLVGEDGPTHQPIEQIEMLRSIPGVIVFRPCDRNEMIGAYEFAFSSNRPCVIVANKDILPICENTDIKGVNNGGYILKSSENEKLCIIASGGEVDLALRVSNLLEKHMISSRVVSMPSLDLFAELKKEDREKLLPSDMKKVVIELSSCQSYYKYLNCDDLVFNVEEFLKSGNKIDIISKISYTGNDIANEIMKNLK